ncbi:MAG: Triose-phosphate isomerase [Gammaproteobacteria bacterium]|jgi:triosephosphate isomerase|nr:Triose-phosphate isomerase [Gammaproteobacteria bacterium]
MQGNKELIFMQKYIFGNWKQNGDFALLHTMAEALRSQPDLKHHVAIFPPFVYLPEAQRLLANSAIAIGAQDVSPYEKGAYTGEISASMLKEVGCQYVLIGHSERRHVFGDSDQIVVEKFQQTQQAGLTPVLCIGETLEEFEAGRTKEVIHRQLKFVMENQNLISATADTSRHANLFLIAYEPVWAIGTGKAATSAQAQAVHAYIRSLISRVPILYGGSVKADNAAELLAMPDIDGLLIGGASLIPEQFLTILSGHY